MSRPGIRTHAPSIPAQDIFVVLLPLRYLEPCQGLATTRRPPGFAPVDFCDRERGRTVRVADRVCLRTTRILSATVDSWVYACITKQTIHEGKRSPAFQETLGDEETTEHRGN